jgi:HD-GYP domain-containing protein (c-di-GMP phosphodiesterase class II)
VLSGEADGLMSAGLEETVLLVDDRAKGALGSEAVAAPVRFEGKVAAVLLAGGKRPDDDGDPALSSFESQFLAACADLIGVIHENMARFAERKALFLGTVRALTSAIDAKHPYTRGHSDRVALLGKAMAKEIGLGDVVAETYHLAGLLHDVGKIGVSETILSKPSKLTDEEFAAIKTHPRVGHEILRDIPGLDDVLPGVLHHHEQWAGGGYPSRLKGEEIPLIARVLALADTFDAMSSSRSYREALSRETVLGEIRKCAGRQFEPGLAEAFVALDFTEYDAMAAGERAEARLAA